MTTRCTLFTYIIPINPYGRLANTHFRSSAGCEAGAGGTAAGTARAQAPFYAPPPLPSQNPLTQDGRVYYRGGGQKLGSKKPEKEACSGVVGDNGAAAAWRARM